MVKLTEYPYHLNDRQFINAITPALTVGESSKVGTPVTLELFDRSLLRTGDIEKLPLLVSLKIALSLSAAIATAMATATVIGSLAGFSLFNSKDDDPDWLIDYGTANAFYQAFAAAATFAIAVEDSALNFQGAILLSPTICLTPSLNVSNAVGAGGMPAGLFMGTVQLEVDWVKVSSEQLDEYVKEYLFSRI